MIPQRESTRSGLFCFPADMPSLKKTQNKHAENHKDKFGRLCGKAWSRRDSALTHTGKGRRKDSWEAVSRKWGGINRGTRRSLETDGVGCNEKENRGRWGEEGWALLSNFSNMHILEKCRHVWVHKQYHGFFKGQNSVCKSDGTGYKCLDTKK